MLSQKKYQQHMEQFHPEQDVVKVPSSIPPFGVSRVGTDATLVELGDDDKDDGEDEDEDDDAVYGKIEKLWGTDGFALRTTNWTS